MRVLENDEILLRPIERSDLESLNRWKNDEEVYRYLGGGYLPVSSAVQEKWLDALMDTTGGSKRFIIQKKGGSPIGMIGLYHINWIHRTCELGILIGEPACRRKGYAYAAYLMLEEYARKYLNLRKIRADVVKNNEAALNLYEKLNFHKAGRLEKERFINGKYCDLMIMEKFFGLD